MIKQFGVSTNEIHQEDSLKVPVSNRSTIGPTVSYFRRAPCSQPSIRRKRAKMKCLSNLELVLITFIRKAFSKYLFLNRSTKGATISSFPRALCS